MRPFLHYCSAIASHTCAFALPKGLAGVKGERKPGLPLSQQQYFILKEAASRLLPMVHIKGAVLVATKI